jgi:hypothetical protein
VNMANIGTWIDRLAHGENLAGGDRAPSPPAVLFA